MSWLFRVLRRPTQYMSRNLSTMSPVKLSYEKFDVNPGQSANTPPLLITHGMSGSKEGWRGIADRLNKELLPYRTVYTIDARNHGQSPWTDHHTYDLMTEDLQELCKDLGISKASFLGHSMGGRTMLNFALNNVSAISSLWVCNPH